MGLLYFGGSEDWFAVFEVKLVAKKASVEKAADTAAEEIQKSTGGREDRAKLLDYAKRAVVKLSIYQRQLGQKSFKTPSTSVVDSAPKPNNPPKTVRKRIRCNGRLLSRYSLGLRD